MITGQNSSSTKSSTTYSYKSTIKEIEDEMARQEHARAPAAKASPLLYWWDKFLGAVAQSILWKCVYQVELKNLKALRMRAKRWKELADQRVGQWHIPWVQSEQKKSDLFWARERARLRQQLQSLKDQEAQLLKDTGALNADLLRSYLSIENASSVEDLLQFERQHTQSQVRQLPMGATPSRPFTPTLEHLGRLRSQNDARRNMVHQLQSDLENLEGLLVQLSHAMAQHGAASVTLELFEKCRSIADRYPGLRHTQENPPRPLWGAGGHS